MRSILLAISLASCAPIDLPMQAATPPVLIAPIYVVAGDRLELATMGIPGQVWYVASRGVGGASWCPAGFCLGVDPGVVLGSVTAMGGGTSLAVATDPSLPAGLGYVQAANASGVMSNVAAISILPRGGDLDGDGLSNADETGVWFTDPANPDSDGAGESDGDEVRRHGDPTSFVDDLPAIACGGGYDAVLGRLVCVPRGAYTMGCVQGRDTPGCLPDEGPTRIVAVTHDLWVMETEVLQSQWIPIMRGPSPIHAGMGLPMDNVRWSDAVAFADALSQLSGLPVCGPSPAVTCMGWRLPTEAEWEGISRGGVAGPYPGGAVDDVAWTSRNAVETQPACLLARNGFGLCDMGGNVWEWASDWYQSDYTGLGDVDPQGPSWGNRRVVRGGGFTSPATQARSAQRWSKDPALAPADVGLRLVRTR